MARRKYNPKQKNYALEKLQDCQWTKEKYKEIEQSLYNKFRDDNSEMKFGRGGYIKFVKWYIKTTDKQKGNCKYCGLEGKVSEYYEKQLRSIRMWAARGFRKGNRGKSLEIDRKKPKQPYNEGCVLACYPCNNAKSDVFTDEEFKIIGAVIGVLKGKGKTKRIKELKTALKKLQKNK